MAGKKIVAGSPPPFDPDYVTKVLEFLLDISKGVVEIRIFPKVRRYDGKTVSGYYDDITKIGKDVARYDGKASIYFLLNPADRRLLARSANHLTKFAESTTNDNDIVEDRWLPIDIDPIRPSNVSSTDAELKKARLKQKVITNWLGEKKIPFLTADSGNGTHILIPLVGYPNTDKTREDKKRFIGFLHDKFSDKRVDVDSTVSNMARIWKLYGTMACKKDNIPAQPHRRSYLNLPTGRIEPVDLYAMLDELIPVNEAKLVNKKKKNIQGVSSSLDLDVEGYLSHYGVGVSQRKDKGDYICWELEECPFDPSHNRGESSVFKFVSGATWFKCQHETCKNRMWKDFKERVGDPKAFYKGGTPFSISAMKIERPKNIEKRGEAQIMRMFLRGMQSPRANGKRLVKETPNAFFVLWSAVSTRCTVPINLAVLGQAGAGKTEIVMAVEQLIPPLWTTVNNISLMGSFTPKSLKYMASPIWYNEGEKGAKKGQPDAMFLDLEGKIIIVTDDTGDQAEFINSIKPILSRDKPETSFFVAPSGSVKRGMNYIVKGWPVMIALSTKTEREAEALGRFFTISPKQPYFMDIIKDKTFRNQYNLKEYPGILSECRKYLSSLRKVEVILPFDVSSTWEKMDREQTLRHYDNFTSLIKQIACFFQHRRPKIDDNTILANKGDFELAALLVSPLMKAMKANVPPVVVKFFESLREKYGASPFYRGEVIEWAMAEWKVTKSTITNTYWGALKDSGLLDNADTPEDKDKRRKYYKISQGGGEIDVDYKMKIDYVLDDEWKKRVGVKVKGSLDAISEDYYPFIKDIFTDAEEKLPKKKHIVREEPVWDPSLNEVMEVIRKLVVLYGGEDGVSKNMVLAKSEGMGVTREQSAVVWDKLLDIGYIYELGKGMYKATHEV